MAKKIENAQKIVDKLVAKQAELAASAKADEVELESIAFAAYSGEDQKAQTALESIKDRTLRRD